MNRRRGARARSGGPGPGPALGIAVCARGRACSVRAGAPEVRLRVVALVLASSIGLGAAVASESSPPEPPVEAPDPPLALPAFPLVPWASPGLPDAEIGPPPSSFHGTWSARALEPPLIMPRRAPPSWLAWAVRTPTPQPRSRSVPFLYEPPPEPEITAMSVPAAPPPARPLKRYEIVVWGERLQAAEQALADKFDAMGYHAHRRGDGYTVWAPADPADRWRPKVTVYDDGWYTVKMGSVSGGTPGVVPVQGAPAHGHRTAPSFDRAPAAPAVGLGFAFSSRRQRMAAEARVARQIHGYVGAIRDARSDGELLARLDAMVTELDAIWYGGRGPDGRRLASVDERKRAMLALWSTRTETSAGETVRAAIADYLLGQVDPESSLPTSMVAEAERACGCPFPWPWRRASESDDAGD
jgi:hypothetical protein